MTTAVEFGLIPAQILFLAFPLIPLLGDVCHSNGIISGPIVHF